MLQVKGDGYCKIFLESPQNVYKCESHLYINKMIILHIWLLQKYDVIFP